MKIIFLLTHIPNPRINKRIDMFKEKYNTFVICVRRKKQNIWEPLHGNVKHCIFEMDMPESSHIFKRIMSTFKFIMFAYKQLANQSPECLYVEGFDSLLMACLYKTKNKNTIVIYEVADLRELIIYNGQKICKQIIKHIFLFIEKQVFKCVDHLIVTSEQFYIKHYCKLIDKRKVIFIPNMPDLKAFSTYKKKEDGKFTIGFVGGIRYLDQMRMLVDVAQSNNVNVLFAGAGGSTVEEEEIRSYCNGKPYVTFWGKYDYYSDIAKLYGLVDCVYAVYDADNPNVRIALPNKLYEAVYCELPIIVAKNTYLEELVVKWNVGISVSHRNRIELEEIIQKLSKRNQYYQSFVNSCKKNKSNINIEIYNKQLSEVVTKYMKSHVSKIGK